MTGNEYQILASRTIATKDFKAMREHSLFGMASEVGELLGLYQKRHQGHKIEEEHAMKEAGDVLWMLAEYATSMGWELEEVMEANIEKLWKRYPEGFDEERSKHRQETDI